MEGEHPTVDQMLAFLQGRLGIAETKEIVRHLLRRCESCRNSIREASRIDRPPRGGDEIRSYDAAFLNAVESVRDRELDLAHERVVAPGLIAALAEVSPQEGRRRVRFDGRFQSWGLCEQLMEESRTRIFSGNPSQAVELAALAVEVSDVLAAESYSRDLLVDLRARARAELGNAQRTDADFEAARRSFAEARALAEQGTGDRGIEARIASLEASLLIDLGQWEEAIESLERPLALYRSMGEEDLVARTLVKQAIPLGLMDPAAAIARLAEAEVLIKRGENPRLFLGARHNRICFLNDAGRTEAALLLLDDSRPLYRQFQDDWSQLRLSMLEARIALGLGHLDEAEAALSQLWSFVFERNLRLELALVTLDLTAVHLAKGEHQKAWRLAGRLVPLFQSWGVHRHAMAAWLVLQKAFAGETATAGLVREVARYLQRSWKNPDLAFEARSVQ